MLPIITEPYEIVETRRTEIEDDSESPPILVERVEHVCRKDGLYMLCNDCLEIITESYASVELLRAIYFAEH